MHKIHHIKDAPPTLEEAQALVGGYVTMLRVAPDQQMLCDEEGSSMHKQSSINEAASMVAGQPIYGDVIVLEGKALWT